MKIIKNFKVFFILILFIFIAVFLRFYNLNWGAPYYFHPDERNIASSVSQLHVSDQMNPHFFAYGSLPIYAIYFSGIILNSIQYPISNIQSQISNVTFEQAIIISRFYSALFSLLLIPILFLIGKKLKNEKAGLLAAFLATTSVGFIQFAHFGTFEMWLTFFGVFLFWLCIKKITENIVFLMGLLFGILIATKVSSIVLLPMPLIAIFIHHKINSKKSRGNLLLDSRSWIVFAKNLLLFLIIFTCIYIISNPYVFHDTKAFQSSMRYESTLAIGTLPVFYTGEFYNTVPGFFHFLYIYPFLLNPLITILFIPSFIYIVYGGIKTKNFYFLLLSSFFLILFLSQIFLFVKWTRYLMPTLPFVYLIVAITTSDLITKKQKMSNGAIRLSQSLQAPAMTIITLVCGIFAFSYFITVFTKPDTRIAAQEFAKKTISPNVPVLSEVYDLGIMPFNNAFQRISLFNFYDLDSRNPNLSSELNLKLNNSEYIILPSQRLLKIRLHNPAKFPNGYDFYNKLITGKLGYEKVYETPCDLLCKITYMGDPVSRYEETANVFDRPTVFIFRKK